MRVCLQCNSEYLDDPTTCRSCGAETVTPAEAELQHKLRERLANEKLVVVTQLEGPVDESILSRLMLDAGIAFAVHGGSHGHMPGVDHSIDRWGTLVVPEARVEAAARIIRHYRQNVVIEDLDDQAEAAGLEE